MGCNLNPDILARTCARGSITKCSGFYSLLLSRKWICQLIKTVQKFNRLSLCNIQKAYEKVDYKPHAYNKKKRPQGCQETCSFTKNSTSNFLTFSILFSYFVCEKVKIFYLFKQKHYLVSNFISLNSISSPPVAVRKKSGFTKFIFIYFHVCFILLPFADFSLSKINSCVRKSVQIE